MRHHVVRGPSRTMQTSVCLYLDHATKPQSARHSGTPCVLWTCCKETHMQYRPAIHKNADLGLQHIRIHIMWCVPNEIYSRANNLLPMRQILVFFDLNSLIFIQHRNIHHWSARRPLAVIINAVLKMILTRARSASSPSDPAFLLKKL